MQDYFNICTANSVVPILSLVSVKNNKLMFIEDNISEEEALVIKEFFENCDLEVNPANIVKELYIVDCGMSDECLSYIL